MGKRRPYGEPTMTRKYYSLLVRDTPTSDWQIHFGDYDRHVVAQERRDICANDDYTRRNTRVIATYDTQNSIETAVRLLNVPFDAPFTLIAMTPDNVDQVHDAIADAL